MVCGRFRVNHLRLSSIPESCLNDLRDLTSPNDSDYFGIFNDLIDPDDFVMLMTVMFLMTPLTFVTFSASNMSLLGIESLPGSRENSYFV